MGDFCYPSKPTSKPPQIAYDYFCSEFENMLDYVFGLKDHVDNIGNDSNDTKTMLRNTIITVAYKVYLDKYLSVLHAAEENE